MKAALLLYLRRLIPVLHECDFKESAVSNPKWRKNGQEERKCGNLVRVDTKVVFVDEARPVDLVKKQK